MVYWQILSQFCPVLCQILPLDIPKLLLQFSDQTGNTFVDLIIGQTKLPTVPRIRNMMRILGSDPDHKVYRLLDFTDEPGDIADPWYSGKFGLTYDQIDKGVSYLIGELQQKLWDV